MTWGQRRTIGLVSMAVFGVLGAALFGGAWLVGSPRHPMTDGQAVVLMERGVPLGSSTAQVTAWLNTQRIEHSPYLADGDGGQVFSIIRDTRRSFWVFTDIQVIFTFDRRRRLTGRSVHEVCTGP